MVTNNSSDYSPTQYNVQTGGASGTLNNVAPSSTSGVPVISQGASSQPVFGTAVVAGGGTGDTSFTAYAVICGGTTTTGALQSIASVGSSGNVLTSNGAGALPTFQAAAGGSGFTTINIQTFTSSGTYTPTASMKYCIIECVGGGGGGGTANTGVGRWSSGAGGGGGGYSRKFASSATIGASETVTIGAAGTAGSSGQNAGGSGGDTSVGTICIGKGATGGAGNDGSGSAISIGGAGGVAGTGDITFPGQQGQYSYASTSVFYPQGEGGSSYFGYGGRCAIATPGTNNAGQNYGGGGAGGSSYNQDGASAGSAGAKGVVIVTEYI